MPDGIRNLKDHATRRGNIPQYTSVYDKIIFLMVASTKSFGFPFKRGHF